MICKVTGKKIKTVMSFGKMPLANGFLNKKAYIGPALIVNRGPLIFFTTFLPDQRANSIDYLMMFLFILKLN